MKIIKRTRYNELFKVTSLNSLSVLIKISIGFITSKVIAVFIGPSGMALVGNLRNFITSVENIGMLGFQNGIIKYVAEYENNKLQLRKLLSTIVISIVIATLVLSGIFYFFSSYLNGKIFNGQFQYKSIFIVFALCLPWYIASLFLISVLNGLGDFKKVIRITIYGNILGLVLSLVLIYYYHTFGTLLSVILAPSLLFFMVVFQIKSIFSIPKMVSLNLFDFSIIKNLSEYSLMALVSSVLGPLVYIAIRNTIIEKLGIENAGYCEGMSRISSYYMLFLTTILTVYFLPKLSKAESNKETNKIFWSYFKGVIPVFVVGLIVLYSLKDFLIPILFTKSFTPVTGLFFWQLVGDVFKALSLILGYQFFAKKLTIAFIITELLSLSILYISSIMLIPLYGIQGVVMAYTLTYFLYFLVLSFYFRKYFERI